MKEPTTLNQDFGIGLSRSLSSLETWGFGLTGLLLWMGVAPGAYAEMGPQAIFVWIPGTIIGILINLQVKRLGSYWPDMSGGTPNYTTKLLKNYPGLARFAAIGYFISWVAVLPVNAIILTDLINTNLEPLGISCPEITLRIGFTLLAFIVAFSGTHSLGILHLVFIIPAVGFLLVFCIQGNGWLAISNSSPGLLPTFWSTFDFPIWAKWFLDATYAVYACESASCFVADSKHPQKTLKALPLAGILIPIVYLGGSWVLMRLQIDPSLKDDTFLNLLAAAKPFWGNLSPFLVTFLVVSSSLLACATAVSICPRILYQLSRDGHLSPIFSVTSRQGVLVPGLMLTLVLSIVCLIWGNVPRIVMVTGVGWLSAFICLHWGLWLNRGKPEILWPWWSLGFCIMELVVLVVGGLAWSGQDLLIGLLLPIAILTGDWLIRHLPFAPFNLAWWRKLYRNRRLDDGSDFLAIQVAILIFLVCSAAAVGWFFGNRVGLFIGVQGNILVVLLLNIAFVGVAIACWTSLPQVLSLAEAREQSEHLFNIAIDAIVVLNENGKIIKSNPASDELFGIIYPNFMGCNLNEILPDLIGQPDAWLKRSEHTLNYTKNSIVVEAAISDRFNQDFREYVVILRDITQRKKAEEAVRDYSYTLEEKVKQRTQELAQANTEILALNDRLKADNLRMGAELDVTRKLQEMLLPKDQELSQISQITGLDIAGYMMPADEVGGDYYDVLEHNGNVKISIGDVTGHGLESGLLMLMAQTAVRTLQTNNISDPVQFLDVVNQTLYNNLQRMKSNKNMSLAVLNYQKGNLSISGQHEEIIVVRIDGKIEMIDTMDLGFPIGLIDDIADSINQRIIELNSGDVAVLYTDGITESENMNRQLYGIERLCEVIQENHCHSATEIRQAVIEDLRGYIGEQKVFDDITLVVMKQQ